jgi:hypothetical protein
MCNPLRYYKTSLEVIQPAVNIYGWFPLPLEQAERFCQTYDFQCDFGGKSTCPRTKNQYLRPRFITSYRIEIARCDRA